MIGKNTQLTKLVNLTNTIVGLKNENPEPLFMDERFLVENQLPYKILKQNRIRTVINVNGTLFYTNKPPLGTPGKTQTTKDNAAKVFAILYDALSKNKRYRNAVHALQELQAVSGELARLIMRHRTSAYSRIDSIYGDLGIFPQTDEEKRFKRLVIRTIKFNWQQIYSSLFGEKKELIKQLIKQDEANFFM